MHILINTNTFIKLKQNINLCLFLHSFFSYMVRKDKTARCFNIVHLFIFITNVFHL